MVGGEPVQSPEAMQVSASVVLQFSVDDRPDATDVGLAVNISVGLFATLLTDTTTDFVVLPPAPLHSIVNSLRSDSGPTSSLPLVPRSPVQAPVAMQLSAAVASQLKVEKPPGRHWPERRQY